MDALIKEQICIFRWCHTGVSSHGNRSAQGSSGLEVCLPACVHARACIQWGVGMERTEGKGKISYLFKMSALDQIFRSIIYFLLV